MSRYKPKPQKSKLKSDMTTPFLVSSCCPRDVVVDEWPMAVHFLEFFAHCGVHLSHCRPAPDRLCMVHWTSTSSPGSLHLQLQHHVQAYTWGLSVCRHGSARRCGHRRGHRPVSSRSGARALYKGRLIALLWQQHTITANHSESSV